jgi:hypothetical protein
MSALYFLRDFCDDFTRENRRFRVAGGDAQRLKTRGPHDRQGHEVLTLYV